MLKSCYLLSEEILGKFWVHEYFGLPHPCIKPGVTESGEVTESPSPCQSSFTTALFLSPSELSSEMVLGWAGGLTVLRCHMTLGDSPSLSDPVYPLHFQWLGTAHGQELLLT